MLLTMPTGKPSVAPLKPFDYEQVYKDAERKLAGVPQNERFLSEWRDFVDARPKTAEDAAHWRGPPKRDFAVRPPLSGPTLSDQIAARAALERAVVVQQPQTIRSSVADGAEGRAEREARALLRQLANDATAQLRVNSFAMAAIPVSDQTPQLPRRLVQLPGILAQDTTQPDAVLVVVCWTPVHGKYDREWKVTEEQCQIRRDAITVINVEFTQKEELRGGFRKLNGKTKRYLAVDNGAKYSEYSVPARPR